MDLLAPEILKAVYSFLPSTDRLTTRRLSSKFNSLISYPFSLVLNKIQQNKNAVYFVYVRYPMRIMQIIEIVKVTQKTASSWKDGRLFRLMTVHCNQPNYNRFIDIYMNFLVTKANYVTLELIHLNDTILAKLRKSLKVRPDFDWTNAIVVLKTGSKIVTQEQRKFMNFCQGPKGFYFLPSTDFQMPKDFWELAPIARAKTLYFAFGSPFDWSTVDTVIDVDVGINDDLFRKLVEKKMTNFLSNGLASVSTKCIKEYITNCLNGCHALRILSISHKYTNQQLQEIKDHLLHCGFMSFCGEFLTHRKEPRSGETAQLKIRLSDKFIQIRETLVEYTFGYLENC